MVCISYLEPKWSSDQPDFVSVHACAALPFNFASHTGAFPDHVKSARQALQTKLGVPRVHWLSQVHGVSLVDVDVGVGVDMNASSCPQDQTADGVISAIADQAVAVLTADCVPLLFRDIHSGKVGAVHAGWRGLAGGIIQKACVAFNVQSLEVSIGPCISQVHFEVGADVLRCFKGQERHFTRAEKPDKWLCDLKALAQEACLETGVLKRNIAVSKLCTFADTDLPSYRRDKTPKRLASVILHRS